MITEINHVRSVPAEVIRTRAFGASETSNGINPLSSAPFAPKKRVLFLITQTEIGGAQRFLYDLANHLEPEKYQVLVAAGRPDPRSPHRGWFLQSLEENKIVTFEIKNLKREISPLKDWLAVFELRRLIKKVQPDILFLNSSKAGFVGSLATVFPFKLKTENHKLKIVYRIGGWTFNDPWPSWKRLLWIALEKISAKWKDVIIVNSAYDFDQAKKMNIKPREKLALVYNGLDVYKADFLEKEEARLRLFEKISRQWGKIFQIKTVVGAVSNFYPAKKIEDLVAAAEYFKDADSVAFFVIGDGPEKTKIEKIIKEKNLEKKVFLLGQIPQAQKFLKAFDVFVLPSVKEGFPWALIEAMAAKLPIVATRVGAIPEIIEDGKNGLLVEPGDPQAMADKIKEILDSSHLQKEFGIQAHQTVLFKFELDKMVKQIEDLL